jgi:cellulose biosynthesis protein BcsQ
MTKTITLCSGKGGVGKTVLATSLARILQQEEHGNILLVDLDLSVRGLTLLAFQNKYELDHMPFSLATYLDSGPTAGKGLLEGLHKSFAGDDHGGHSPYRRLEKIFILPSSTESERPDWMQSARITFESAEEKLNQLQTFAQESLNVGFIVFDTQAGPGSLSLAAATLSDINIIILEEDDISWRTALNMLLEISDLNKQLHRKARSYFLTNKVGPELLDAAGKLKAFSFLPPLPYDAWMQKLFARATSAALEKEFERTDLFRQVHSRVWNELASILGLTATSAKESSSFVSWWNKKADKSQKPVSPPIVRATPPSARREPASSASPARPSDASSSPATGTRDSVTAR